MVNLRRKGWSFATFLVGPGGAPVGGRPIPCQRFKGRESDGIFKAPKYLRARPPITYLATSSAFFSFWSGNSYETVGVGWVGGSPLYAFVCRPSSFVAVVCLR